MLSKAKERITSIEQLPLIRFSNSIADVIGIFYNSGNLIEKVVVNDMWELSNKIAHNFDNYLYLRIKGNTKLLRIWLLKEYFEIRLITGRISTVSFENKRYHIPALSTLCKRSNFHEFIYDKEKEDLIKQGKLFLIKNYPKL